MSIDDLKAQVSGVADDLVKAEIIGTIVLAIELVNGVYELYKNCWPDASKAKAYLADNYSGGVFSKRVMRPACRQVIRAARAKGMELTDDQIEEVAKATLLKAMSADDGVVAACYVSQDGV